MEKTPIELAAQCAHMQVSNSLLDTPSTTRGETRSIKDSPTYILHTIHDERLTGSTHLDVFGAPPNQGLC